MIILGLHFGHDSSVVLVIDGVVVAFLEKERKSRVKHAIGLDITDVRDVLAQANVLPSEVDYCSVTSTQGAEHLFFDPEKLSFQLDGEVAELIDSPWYEMMSRADEHCLSKIEGRSRLKQRFNPDFPDSARDHYDLYLKQYLGNPQPNLSAVDSFESFIFLDGWRTNNTLPIIAQTDYSPCITDAISKGFHLPIRLRLDGATIPGVVMSHHYAHAAYAFYSSPYEQAAILTHDAGDPRYFCDAGMFYYGSKSRMYPITPHYLHSGIFYDTVAEMLGLGVIGGAGKLMGLAAYGKPRFYSRKYAGNWFDCQDAHGHPPLLAKAFVHESLAIARTLGYDESVFADKNRITEAINADIAASAQKIVEESMLSAADAFADALRNSKISTPNLCLSGGVALNCPVNSRLFNESRFPNVFVPPACGDSGLSIGSAYALYFNIFEKPRPNAQGHYSKQIYLGREYRTEEYTEALNACADLLQEVPCEDAASDAATILRDGGIIGWFEGRSEIGPRALGHRSIVANPTRQDSWERVNHIKSRELWRPLAPATLEETAADWFSGVQETSPYMLFNALVRSSGIPAVTHVNGTARIQTVSPGNGLFYHLIKSFAELTGVPVVLNTSFNGPGEPIVETPLEAMRFFIGSKLSALYINGKKITGKNA